MALPNPQVSSTCSNWVGSFILVRTTGLEPALVFLHTQKVLKSGKNRAFYPLKANIFCSIKSASVYFCVYPFP